MKISLYFAVLSTLTLSACATNTHLTDDASKRSSKQTVATIETPEIVNYTPFPGVVLNGHCADHECSSPVEYYSWSTKISYDFDQRGRLKLSAQQEPSLSMNDASDQDRQCSEKGATFNQRTIWYPHTGIFIRGGALQSVKDAGGGSLALRPLGELSAGEMAVIGKAAKAIEYSYAPCVGRHRVTAGSRLDSYLPRGAKLVVKPEKGQALAFSLPEPTEPWVLLRYRSGAMIPVPMRLVMVTLDMTEKRMVTYYQSTFPMEPPLRKIEMRAILPDQTPAQGETPERHRERTEATLLDLRQCSIPQSPMEPCSAPDRRPLHKIFSH